MSNRKKTIVFDVGKVLIDFDAFVTIRKLEPLAGRPVPQSPHPFAGKMEDDYEKGLISRDEFFGWIKSEYALSAEIDLIEKAFNDMLTDEVPGMRELVGKLSDDYNLVALTNTTPSHYRTFMQRYPIMKYFTEVVASPGVGFRKPEPGIYGHVEKILGGARPVLFVDDREENLDGARSAGWPVALFTGCEALSTVLKKSGLLQET